MRIGALAAAVTAVLLAGSAARAADLATPRHHHRARHRLVDAEPPSVPPGYAYGGYGNGPGPGWSDAYGPPGYGPGYGYIPPGSPDAGFDLGR